MNRVGTRACAPGREDLDAKRWASERAEGGRAEADGLDEAKRAGAKGRQGRKGRVRARWAARRRRRTAGGMGRGERSRCVLFV